MLSQKLQQKLLQKLSPQQILLMKLLQIPSMALEQRIKQEIEENPALEETELQFEDEYIQPDGPADDFQDPVSGDEDHSRDEPDDFSDPEPIKDRNEEFDFEDYLEDDDTPLYRLQANNSSPDDETHETPFVSGLSFQEMLLQQLGLRVLTDKQMVIGQQIIGNIDDSGYLNREIDAMIDDLAFIHNLEVKRSEVVGVLEVVQQLDPPGIAARTLRECLLLQLRRKPQTMAVQGAIKIIDRNFNEFTKKHFDKIQKKIQLSDEQMKEAVNEILSLNPKPGNSLNENQRTTQYIVPDFFVYNNDGELELVLNSRNMPELKLNRTYTEMLETYVEAKGKATSQQKEAVMFVKQKVDSARWFIDAIKQRQHTLSVTMTAIMEYQREFFLTGDEKRIKPMILKDIAERVRLDISTISRVANSKYVQTPYGTYLLKYFFSEALTNDSGEEVSTREIKKILTDCLDGEDKTKPLTDEELMNILKEKGYVIARRTIAKYREQLGIPVARLRRELQPFLLVNSKPYPEVIAKIISVVSHPMVLIQFYLQLSVLNRPKFDQATLLKSLMVFLFLMALPVLSIIWLKKIGRVSSWEMESRKERTVPFLLMLVFNTTLYGFLVYFDLFPELKNLLLLGGSLVAFALLVNLFWKISIHMIGLGSLASLVSYNGLGFHVFNVETNLLVVITCALVAALLVAFSRYKLKAHNPAQIIAGWIAGFALTTFWLYIL